VTDYIIAMFSPLAFPAGMIVYDLTTSLPPQSHMALAPFEVHREPLAIIAIADGDELGHVSYRNSIGSQPNGNGNQVHGRAIRELDQELELVRDQYPKALVHQLLIFDFKPLSESSKLPEGLIGIPPRSASNLTTMKTVMCDLSSLILAEMTTLAKSLQGMSLIESPNKTQQAAKVGNDYSWPSPNLDPLSRRNSQFAIPGQGIRNESPGAKPDKSLNRMTMPAQLRSTTSDSFGSTPSSRPSTPMNGSSTPDETPTSGPPGSKSPPSGTSFGGNAIEKFREHSRDRISVQGFGSGSVSDRSRIKGKGRIGIVIGSLYLQAGRWGDALRELTEGATIAQSINDHLWHAKALENIVIGMLMLAWAGLDFQIPHVCYISADKAPYHTPPASALGKKLPSNRLAALQNLSGLLPELLDKILYIYGRASNFAGEDLPQLPFSETVIRFSKLLTYLHLAGGKFDDDMLQLIVTGTPLPVTHGPQLNVQPSRSVIVAMLFRAFPSSSLGDDYSVIDRTIILAGIASVLDSMCYYRKKAMVMRELVSILIPGLIQARKIGAAEMGIHPAAGLAALNAVNGSTNGAGALELGEGDVESGMDELLSLMNRLYGVVSFETSATRLSTKDANHKLDESDEATVSRIMSNATMRAFGGQNLKMNVLRACINLAEALPDFQGVLRFSSDLLRTAGSGLAPGPRTSDASPLMTREEQIRLVTNISRTSSAAKKLGLHNVEAEYWDEFLVRGVELELQPATRILVPHQKFELGNPTAAAESTDRNPFIYNPFLKKPNAAAVDHVLVAEEAATFKVSLQNPYEFDVEIESIRLESDSATFVSGVQSTVIGPYRTQIMSISGTPNSSGILTITGCYVKVRGCRERRFPIFTQPWTPQVDTKIKAAGLMTLQKLHARPNSTASAAASTPTTASAPNPTSLKLTVVDKQPIVVLKSTTLSQSAAMVLEGEQQMFSITLQNISTTPVDLLLFSFQDSTQAPLQTALSKRDASPAELYEYELILARKQALRWIKKGDEVPYIEPGGTASFDFEILGKPGLVNAIVQVDYTYLGVLPSEAPAKFYTRQATLPLTATVNASVELVRMDVLSLAGDIPHDLWPGTTLKDNFNAEEYCLLLLDLRNAWPSQLHLHLELGNGREINEDILPGNTSRVVFPVRRIFLEDPYASIPTLDPARQRQFVVSSGKISADTERATREAFWYREEILKPLRATWKTMSGRQRNGTIELRGIRLGSRMIETIKIEDIGIELTIDGAKPISSGENKYEVSLDNFLHVKVRIVNRTKSPTYPILRLQPSLRNHAYNSSLDLSKKIVVDGTLQHSLSVIAANQSIEVTIAISALCRGEFEINASVEEARLSDYESSENISNNNEELVGRPRANTKTMMDSILGQKERRIWHAREPCVLIVRDGESSDEEG
jgi:hypothetical protein